MLQPCSSHTPFRSNSMHDSASRCCFCICCHCLPGVVQHVSLCTWRCPSDRPGPSPYEERQPQPSLSLVPGAHPLAAPPDQAHVFHMGWGKDLCASTIILLARLAWWSGTSLERRLAAAFNAFTAWRVAAGAYSSLTEFSLKKFKIKSRLGVEAAALFWGGKCAHMLMKYDVENMVLGPLLPRFGF